MATIVPSPEVQTQCENAPGGRVVVKVSITREGKGRHYEALGNTSAEAVTDVVRQIIRDPYSAEWLP